MSDESGFIEESSFAQNLTSIARNSTYNVASSSEHNPLDVRDVAFVVYFQGVCRGTLARQRFQKAFRDGFTKHFINDSPKYDLSNMILLKYGAIIITDQIYSDNLDYLMRLMDKLVASIHSVSKSTSFAALFLSAHFIQRASRLISRLFALAMRKIGQADLCRITSVRLVSAVANFLHAFSACDSWTFAQTNANILHILETLCTKISTAQLADSVSLGIFSRVLREGLKEKKTIFSSDVVNKLFMVVLRIFKRHEISENSAAEFENESSANRKTRILCLEFFSCPALFASLSTETICDLKAQNFFSQMVHWLAQNLCKLDVLASTDCLNLLANFVQFSYVEHEALIEHLFEWTSAVNFFLNRCQSQTKKRNVNNWHHPILGWTSERIDEGTQGTFNRVSQQLGYLWSRRIVGCLFGRVLNSIKAENVGASGFGSAGKSSWTYSSNSIEATLPAEIVQKVLSKLSLRNQQAHQAGVDDSHSSHRRELPPVLMTAVVCQLYQNALITFTNSQIEILSGLCQDDSIFMRLWRFVNRADGGGLGFYLSLLSADPDVSSPHFSPLHLFADTAFSLISILDEKEMYESDRPFNVDQLREIARFTNIFCFKVLWEKLIDLNKRRPAALFQSVYQLCMILYNRDCRRSFTAPLKDFWIVPSTSSYSVSLASSGVTSILSSSGGSTLSGFFTGTSDAGDGALKRAQIIAQFERHAPNARALIARMPHVVPLHERMLLFRKLITKEKDRLSCGRSSPTLLSVFASGAMGGAGGAPTTVITVERQRIVEDGYRQLASLTPDALRGTIRVKFINQQGLDEAGIDQDGVFKEFLELTLKKVFDPQLNLFKTTSNSLLYPSSTSSIHENHLALFQFVGRMLAKAVFEGICVDVHLAPVLLATVLGKQLCPFDELATLDSMLYRNLTYVKHYNHSEDVRDLALNFSYNEEFLGKMRTFELIPGGQDIEVNNENKIIYIHKMAQFRVIKQTKEQCEHFVRGFRSILDPKWLSLFSTHELQYLISGHTSDIDLEDLRKHTQYYGGFHSNHRVIKWLWSILHSEFNVEERQLFLKFVTSCSRAPLLGFEYLEPPFSIRCVETSDDMDQGDTLGSIVRGFLAIKRKQPMTRLPTASTCFNLLKLPNYGKRSVLLEKLRYAIRAESGFELS